MSLTIHAARWVVPVTAPVIEDGAVAIEAGRIRAVGERQSILAAFSPVRLVDHGEAALLPGLINVHTHLELTLLRGRVEEPLFQPWIVSLVTRKAPLTPADLLTSARLGCAEALRAGITTVADTADAPGTLVAICESGLRGTLFQECFGPDPAQVESSLQQLRLKLDAHRAYLAGEPGADRVRLGISPHAPYSVSDRLYRRATRLALEQGLDLALHAAESQDERRLLWDGSGAFGDSLRRRQIPFTPPRCSTVRYLDQLGVLAAAPLLIHGVTIDSDDLDLLVRHGVRLAHCPKSNSKFGHGIAAVADWKRRGLAIGLGTDSVASNNGGDLIEEGRFATLLQRAHRGDSSWPSAADALALMTIEGARALRLQDQVGSIEPGKKADLTVVDLSGIQTIPVADPVTTIIFSASARDVIMTMVEGRILYDGKTIATIDEDALRRECRRITSEWE